MIEHIATPITGINSPVNSSIQVQSAIFKKKRSIFKCNAFIVSNDSGFE